MANDILKRILRLRSWMNSHRGITAAFLAVIMAGGSVGGLLIFEHNSGVSITAHEGALSIQTTIVGVSTNAQNNPITLGGVQYTSADINSFTETTSSTSPISTLSLSDASGFVPGDYVYFAITVTNTGHVALNVSTYTITAYYVDSTGNMLPVDWSTANNQTLPAGNGGGLLGSPTLTDYSALNDYYLINNTFATYSITTSTDPYGEGPSFGMDSFSQSYAYFNESTYNQQWFADNSVPTPVNPLVEPGQSFTWYLFFGLGSNAPLNIPDVTQSYTFNLVPVH